MQSGGMLADSLNALIRVVLERLIDAERFKLGFMDKKHNKLNQACRSIDHNGIDYSESFRMHELNALLSCGNKIALHRRIENEN